MSSFGSRALRGLAFALLTLAQLCFAAHASAQAGTVLATHGQNKITRAAQTITPLKPGNLVQANDIIQTEANGRLQVRFVDGAIVSMQPGTQFSVDQYQFQDEEESSFFSLFRGAIRMASGLIGKKDPQQWRLTTPSATVGIRGTHFVVEHTVCDPDCSPGTEPGTRVAVTQGEVQVSNAVGTIVLGANQSAFVSDQNTPPLADRWTPELLPRTVPTEPTRIGPGRSTQPGGTGDTDEAENAGSNDASDSKRTNESSPGSIKPIGNGANNGLRWQPDQVNPFDPVREIALADPSLVDDEQPTGNQQPDNSRNNGDGADENDQADSEGSNDNGANDNTNDQTGGGELAENEDSNNDSNAPNAPNNDADADNGNTDGGKPGSGTGNGSPTNSGENQNQGGNDPTEGVNDPDGSDPGGTDSGGTDPNVGNPGEPSINEPIASEPGDPDPGTNNPNEPGNPVEPGPSNSTTPETGSSFAANWFLDLRPVPNLVQQGLLADPQSAVVFSEGITLESIGRCDGGICISRGTAQVADAGHDEYAAWGRWTNGQMHIQVFGLTQRVTLSENEGLHYIVGSPAVTVPTSGSFSYNLTAATSPTMSHDWYAPGKFSGQASVQFSAGTAPRVGLDAQVDIANDQFRFNTTGGAADPSQSELTLDSNLRFSGQLNANGGQETLPWMCGSVGCRARVEGALFGPTGERLGVSYSIQSESGSTRINGVGIFSRP